MSEISQDAKAATDRICAFLHTQASQRKMSVARLVESAVQDAIDAATKEKDKAIAILEEVGNRFKAENKALREEVNQWATRSLVYRNWLSCAMVQFLTMSDGSPLTKDDIEASDKSLKDAEKRLDAMINQHGCDTRCHLVPGDDEHWVTPLERVVADKEKMREAGNKLRKYVLVDGFDNAPIEDILLIEQAKVAWDALAKSKE